MGLSYFDMLRNKNICIVGGCDNYDETFLNQFDVVIRINNHWVRQGGQCNVLYHCLDRGLEEITELLTLFPKRLIMHLNTTSTDILPLKADFPKHIYYEFKQARFIKPSPYGPEHEWLNVLQNIYCTDFFTGIVALADTLRYPINRVFVCGMDLYVTLEHNGRVGKHLLPGNLNYLRDLKRSAPRVQFDQPLNEALEHYIEQAVMQNKKIQVNIPKNETQH